MGLLSRFFFPKRKTPAITPSPEESGGWGTTKSSSKNAGSQHGSRIPHSDGGSRALVVGDAVPGVPSPDSPQQFATLLSDSWKLDVELDRSTRSKIIASLLDPGPYTKEEEDKVNAGLLIADKLSDGNNREITLTKHDTGTSLREAYVCHDSESNVTFGKVTVTVQGASVLDLGAYLLDYESNHSTKHAPNANRIASQVLERVNNHHQVWYYRGRGTGLFQDRDFVFDCIVKRLTDDQYVFVLRPTMHVDAPITSDVVRATSTRVFRLTKISENVTKLELFVKIDIGGIIPIFLTNSIVLPASLRVAQHVYFMQIREYSDYDKAGKDAKMLGQIFVDATRSLSGETRNAELQTQFHRTAAFRHLFGTYPWLEPCIRYIVRENKKPHLADLAPTVRGNESSSTVPDDVATAEAATTGKSFDHFLRANYSTERGVDDWIRSNQALKQIDEQEPCFFRPFISVLADNFLEGTSSAIKVPRAQDWKLDVERDCESRNKIIAELLDPGPYTKEDDEKVNAGLLIADKLSDGKNPEITLTKLETNTPLEEAYMCYDSERQVSYGKVTATISTSLLDAMAFIFDYDSQFYKHHQPHPNELEGSGVLERLNNHHKIVYYHGRLPSPFHNRDLVWSFIVKRISDDQYVCVSNPALHKDAPITSDTVRAESTRIYKLTKVERDATRLELFVTVDLKGFLPSWITNTIIIPGSLRVTVCYYFMHIKEYEDYDKAGQDAKTLGQMFMDSVRSLSGKARDAELQTQFHWTAAFRHLNGKYTWLPAMLSYVVENKLKERIAAGGSRRGSVSGGSSVVMTEADASEMVGKTFAFDLLSSLISSATPEEAAEQWVSERKNIIDTTGGLDPTFFKSFLTCVGQNLLLERSVGARLEAEAQLLFLEGDELKLDDATKDGNTSPPPIDTSEKISIVLHTIKSNVLAVLISLPALSMIYINYNQLSVGIPAIGGMWGDHHAVLCAACIISVETYLLFIWNFERGYVTRKLLMWPVIGLSFMLINKFAFNDRPGHMSVVVMTVAWALGGIATYPIQKSPRPTFFKHVKKSVVISLLFHGGFGLVIFGQILPTKLLSHSNAVLTSFVTGFAFPFLAWLVRKVAIHRCSKLTNEGLASGRASVQDSLRSFDRLVKAISCGLVITPCALNYLNATIRLAVLSAVLQMVTEVLGKIWIVYFTRKTFVDASATASASGASVDAEKRKKDIAAKLDRAMLLMAARWNGEIVAEKVGIIVTSLIAITLFGENDRVGMTTEQLILVAVIFYGLECVTDLIFVIVMDWYLGVPILSKAINESGIFTKNMLYDSAIMCLQFVATGSCIKMASMVPLPGIKNM